MAKTTQTYEIVRSKEQPTKIIGWLTSGTYIGAYALIILAYTLTLIMTLSLFIA
ncbi:hypothetical protein [Methanonatronarchaeum sp. AMET-Sl]|uniref:hypothetical protein n=1 Tax=Methanonatronarchaeum sp. AMET-Sl TaxID=3037654 RepID=UPI00244E329F|nr:hypothetical protein [Methanonatronarchaeum sp. AMET-Sl]WGI17911.1 hypothetical protein QEN48_02575 [Methanonatronarchaeum sp. AMET-Sl]